MIDLRYVWRWVQVGGVPASEKKRVLQFRTQELDMEKGYVWCPWQDVRTEDVPLGEQ